MTATDTIGSARQDAQGDVPEATAWVPPTWEEIVEQHSARVYRLAYRLTGNPHDAEDLTHDVFIRVFRSLHSYQPGTFEGWLHRITTNVFLDKMRRKQRIRFDALSDERAERLRSTLPTPDMAYADQTFDDDIERALATLPPDFRAAVVLCDVEGLSYEEISEILGAKLGTVRSRIHRGRAMLRTALAHRAPQEGRARYSGPSAAPGAGPSHQPAERSQVEVQDAAALRRCHVLDRAELRADGCRLACRLRWRRGPRPHTRGARSHSKIRALNGLQA